MIPAARVQAAIEALTDLETRRRPAADALKDWGLSHRFAGSGDRAAIASLVYDALRRRGSSSWRLGEDLPRAHVLGALVGLRGLGAAEIETLFSGEKHAPAPLSDAERAGLAEDRLAGAPDHVRGDYPEWLAPAFAESFGDRAADAGRALAERAPVDLRVNTLKSNRDKALAALSHLAPEPTPHSPIGLRIAIKPDGRGPALAAEPSYVKGQVEVQDEASQLAALLSGAAPGQQVLDLCAGAGGKTLALAAMVAGKGQVYATDEDGRRLAPLFARLERSGARNVQVRSPRGSADPVADLAGRCDLVFIDAPCTGSGAWRRNPDAKWRIRPGALAGAHQGAGRDSRAGDKVGQTRRPHCLCDLLGAQGGERGSDRRVSRSPSRVLADRRRAHGEKRGASRGSGFCFKSRGGNSARPAQLRDGRVLRRRPVANGLSCPLAAKPIKRRVGVHADLFGRSLAGLRINPDVGLEADAPRGLRSQEAYLLRPGNASLTTGEPDSVFSSASSSGFAKALSPTRSS